MNAHLVAAARAAITEANAAARRNEYVLAAAHLALAESSLQRCRGHTALLVEVELGLERCWRLARCST